MTHDGTTLGSEYATSEGIITPLLLDYERTGLEEALGYIVREVSKFLLPRLRNTFPDFLKEVGEERVLHEAVYGLWRGITSFRSWKAKKTYPNILYLLKTAENRVKDFQRSRDEVPRYTRDVLKVIVPHIERSLGEDGDYPDVETLRDLAGENPNGGKYSVASIQKALDIYKGTQAKFLHLDMVVAENFNGRDLRLNDVIPEKVSSFRRLEARIDMETVLDGVSKRWKDVLVLYYVYGFLYREIGEIMGFSEGNAKWIRDAAILKIRQRNPKLMGEY